MIHPLLLPELLNLLGPCLDTDDLPSCLQVCHIWHTTLHPFLWHHLTLSDPIFNGPLPLPTQILTHASYIHSIQFISFLDPDEPTDDHLTLRAIAARSTPSPAEPASCQPQLDLLAVFTRLGAYFTNLTEIRVSEPLQMPHLQFLVSLSGSSTSCSLRSLSLTSRVLSLHSSSSYLRNGQKWPKDMRQIRPTIYHLTRNRRYLQSLRKQYQRLERPQDQQQQQQLPPLQQQGRHRIFDFPALKSLTLIVDEMFVEDQLELVLACPNIHHLQWRPCLQRFPLDAFCLALQQGQFLNLKSLDFSESNWVDDELAAVLKALPRDSLRVLDLAGTNARQECLAIIKEHLSMGLRKLNIGGCANLVGEDICPDIMKACPQLRELVS